MEDDDPLLQQPKSKLITFYRVALGLLFWSIILGCIFGITGVAFAMTLMFI